MKLKLLGASALACAFAFSAIHAAAQSKQLKAARPAPTLGIAPDAGLFQRAVQNEPSRKAHTPCQNSDPTDVTLKAKGKDITICGEAGANLANGSPSGTHVYRGIEYARAARWERSWMIDPVAGAASEFGPICPQIHTPGARPLPRMDENCLYLNVWVPNNTLPTAALPVMVFIHGGAFMTGYGSSGLYDGSALAHQNVIVVTLNYRLGALGFLASDTNGTPDWPLGAEGNFGLRDQTVALHWVDSHIAAFGGSPKKVTIFGESAGAMSVGLHVFDMQDYDRKEDGNATLPFSAAIMESDPMDNLYLTPQQSYPIGYWFARQLCVNSQINITNNTNKNSLSCPKGWLKNKKIITTDAILQAQNTFLSQTYPNCTQIVCTVSSLFLANGTVGLRSLAFQPVMDGTIVKGQPFAGYATGAQGIITVFGINKDEGVLFAALTAAAAAKTLGGSPANQPLNFIYDAAIDGSFQPNVSNSTLYSQLASNPAAKGRYDYSTLPPGTLPSGDGYYNSYGTALANVITDSSFVCGNLEWANKVAGPAGSGAPNVYAYLFDQVPFFDLDTPGDNGACVNAAQNTCHGSELPYVFNTLSYAAPPIGGRIPSTDQTLADNMTAAWAAFAQSPSAPGSVWQTLYSSNGPAAKLDAATLPNPPPPPSSPFPTVSLDPDGVCASVWNSILWPSTH